MLRGNRGKKAAQEGGKVEDVLMEDPVCHKLIPKSQAIRLRKDKTTYYFCSEECCKQFVSQEGDKE